MKNLLKQLSKIALIACIAGLPGGLLHAQVADLADAPLANASTSVLPNLMYILDDSGSMNWSYMPDNIHYLSSNTIVRNCKICTTTDCTDTYAQCGSPASNSTTAALIATTIVAGPTLGEAPYYAFPFNQIYYNPNITYAAGVDATGTSLGNQSITAAVKDAYLDSTAVNLTTSYPEFVYCNVTTPNPVQLANPLVCKKNGINNVTAGTPYFLYWGNTGANVGYPTTSFINKIQINTSVPHYYNISAHEYCSDTNLTLCQLATAAGAAPTGFTIPAPVRYCKTRTNAESTAAVSGNVSGGPRCQKKFDATNYPYPRFGRFTRVDIVATTATYPKGAGSTRTDCAAATSCTYAEESTNFANWYSYYSHRLALLKTATGRAFLPIDDRYRVGFITINPSATVDSVDTVVSGKYLPIDTFTATQKGTWYTKLYQQQSASGGTQLREALSRVGRHYANKTTGINDGMSTDPIQYSCQQNFALLTTDGYWNGNGGKDIAAANIGNEDNADSGYTTRAIGAYDGNLGGSTGTLADVAAYYYKTDLRTVALDVKAANNVPTTDKDPSNAQHMTTFTLGLGLQGLMDYSSGYESATTGDFANIKSGTNNACSWTTGTCNWPVPAENSPSAIDDLWHAAVNGHGIYFSAGDPNSLASGLSGALSALKVQTAAASASATSSPNITETDNYIYSSTFRTGKWDGEVVAQTIDTTTGNVLPAITWSARALLDAKTTANSDTRTIWTFDPSATSKLKAFTWANLTSVGSGSLVAEQPLFAGKCTALSQCPLLTGAQKLDADNGQKMVEFLRGWTENEGTLFRDREHVLGDPVNATPAFVKKPQFGFVDSVTPTYATFKTTNAGRQGALYIAANDGMLHALNADNGQEMWAYVPKIVYPILHKLATQNWDVRHTYSVDGSPQTMDAYLTGGWKTLLIAGLGKGGRGFYALDVTDPVTPKGLWEICSDNTLCSIVDTDMGYSFGNPVVTKRKSDGKWVVIVTSGLNNVSPGTGQGFLYVLDAETGTILRKIATGAGSTTTPSGFSKVSAYADSFFTDNTAKYVYGGDLLGNLWRFDLTVDPPTVLNIAQLVDSAGNPQSVTSRPELGSVNSNKVVFVGTGRYLGVSDLSDPSTLTPPLTLAYQQSVYAIKDKDSSYGNIRTANLVQQVLTDSGGITRTITNNPVDFSIKDGWYVDLNPGNTSPGERVNLDPQLVLGTLIVVANIPNNNACTVGGDSQLYQFNFATGSNVDSAPAGAVSRKFTGEILVGNVVIRLPSGIFKGIATGATGTKTPYAIYTGGGTGASRRVSWRELIQK